VEKCYSPDLDNFSFKIGQYNVKLHLVDTVGEDVYGESVTFPNYKVSVSNKLKGVILLSTILHELIHTMSSVHSLGLNEKQVCAMENALYQFIRDNESFVDMICDK
jgi:hypothetical protein